MAPSSIILGSFIYQDRDERQRTEPTPFADLRFLDQKLPQNAFGIELQHLFRASYFNLTSGVGYTDISGILHTTLGTFAPPPMDVIPSTADTGRQHVNAYAYGYVNILRNVTFTVGASFDHLQGDPDLLPGGSQDQFNPKFGITWNPFSGTTLRAAVFRVLKRTLITNQTLEPTQVAGFNQFFDDTNATDAWRYGVAIDQKFTTDLFGGVEASKRDLTIPVLDFSADPANPVARDLDANEYLGRAYVFWTPHAWLALRAEYLFERFENDPLLTTGFTVPKKLNTHRVPLGIGLFHPSGLSASLTATYWNQDGEFLRLADSVFQSGHDAFWTVDAAINYRLPKRYGFITVGATNLFDRKFKFFEVDINNPRIQPDRTFFGRVTLAFP